MAIIASMENEFGFNSDSTYVKIERFSGNKDGIELDILLYASAEAKAENKRPFTRKRSIIPYPTSGVRDIMEYCYNQLKLTAGFFNCRDI